MSSTTSSSPHFFLTFFLTFVLWHSFWTCFGHIFWHSFWHIFWHSLWHIFWHSFWHIFAVEVRRGTLLSEAEVQRGTLMFRMSYERTVFPNFSPQKNQAHRRENAVPHWAWECQLQCVVDIFFRPFNVLRQTVLAQYGDTLIFGNSFGFFFLQITLVGFVFLGEYLTTVPRQCVTQLMNADVLSKGLDGNAFPRESVHKSDQHLNPIWKRSLPIFANIQRNPSIL